MNKMKDSGIEWIGDIPVKWNLIKAKRFFINTKRIVGTDADKYDRLALTLNGVIKRSKDDSEGLQPEKFEGYQILHKNELVFKLIDLENVKTSRVGLSPYTGIVSPAYIVLSNNFDDNRFFYYWFMFMYYNEVFNHLGGEGVRSALNAKDVLSLPVPDINSDEQHCIADYLDRKCSQIDSIITKQQEVIEKLKEYKLSVITEAVTKGLNPDVPMKDSGVEWIGKIPKHWDIVRLKLLGNVRNGLTYSPSDICDANEGTLVLRSSNIQNGQLTFDDNVYVSCEIKDDLMVRPNDILICSRNGSRKLIGKNAIIDDTVATFGAFMMIFRANQKPKYIKYILNSSIFMYYLGTFLTSTINQLTRANLNNMEIPFTWEKDEQEAIVSYLDTKCTKIECLISINQSKIDKLIAYKKSLIYEVVTGKKEV